MGALVLLIDRILSAVEEVRCPFPVVCSAMLWRLWREGGMRDDAVLPVLLEFGESQRHPCMPYATAAAAITTTSATGACQLLTLPVGCCFQANRRPPAAAQNPMLPPP